MTGGSRAGAYFGESTTPMRALARAPRPARCPAAVAASQSAEWPHSPAAAAPRVGTVSTRRFGFSMPTPATMPPSDHQDAGDADAEVEGGGRGVGRGGFDPVGFGRPQVVGFRHRQGLFLGLRRRRAAPPGRAARRRGRCRGRSRSGRRSRRRGSAIASSPATRETPLLTPEAMPTWRSSTESSTVAVSGATVAERPTPKISRTPAARR